MPEWYVSFDDTSMRFVRRILEHDVKEALKRMKGVKVLGPDDVPIEVWRCLENVTIGWLTKLFNHILFGKKNARRVDKYISTYLQQ
jgi:hypothetical protein